VQRLIAAAVTCWLLAVATVVTQEQTGSVRGVVRDVQGGVLPGVAVAISNDNGVALQIVTDAAGGYRYPALPPGRYEVVARLDGFDPVRVVDVALVLGAQLTIDLTLRPAGVAERVEVVGGSPRLAITQATRATSFASEEFERLPRGRDFTAIAAYAPGANDERKAGGIAIDGSTGAENRVMIDGMETTDTWIGTPGQYLATDFVEEVQVKSSGYSAEYGGSTGGVLNVVTKSGSNDWHGQALLLFSGAALDAGPRPTLRLVPSDTTRAEYVTYPEDDYTQVEPGFTLGGPVVRNRAWFFAGYVPSLRDTDRTLTFLGETTPSTFPQRGERHHAAANVSAQLGPRWRTKVAFSSSRDVQRGLLPVQDGTGNPAADHSVDEIVPNYSASASVDYMPSGRAYLSARAGYFFRDSFNEGVYEGDQFVYRTSSQNVPGIPPEFQQPRGFSNVPSNFSRDRARGPHFSVQVDGTITFAAAGRHQVKGGVQFDRVGIDALSGTTGNVISLYWGQRFAGVGGPYGYYSVFGSDTLPNRGITFAGKATVNNVGLFLQDEWTLGPRLTLHAGLRTENEHVPSLADDPSIPPTAIHFGFADKLAPRVGVAWDATADRKTKVYGSWGVFYDITKLQITQGFGGYRAQFFWYTLDSPDFLPIVDNPACPPECPGTLILGSFSPIPPLNDPAAHGIDPGLDQMRLQEFVTGVERELAPALSASARYIHKQIDRALEDVGTQSPGETEATLRIANPGFGVASEFYPGGGVTPLALPKAVRDYDAFEAALERRLSGRWAARAAYTWSRLSGNYSGLAQSDEDGRVAPNIGGVFDLPIRSFDERARPVYGVLATDRPHQVKVQGLYIWPFGTSVGVAWYGASGIPRTREAAYTPGIPIMYWGRNSDGRLPFLSRLDLHVRHDLRLGSRYRLGFSANVMNALNQGTITNYFAQELFPGQFVSVDEQAFFFQGGADTQRLIEEQQLARDARFLLDSGFLAPRSIRLAVALSF
jgi:Carboxypeptidase regulatory-like domain/TonB dependent receptor/TonB-dependent Receptor Plug Domain